MANGALKAPRGSAATRRSLVGLNWLNFLVAAMQMVLGPALSAYLTAQLWNPEKIGVAFRIGTVTAMVAQMPAGALVDAVASKPRAAGAAILAIAVARDRN